LKSFTGIRTADKVMTLAHKINDPGSANGK
jgi:hypothetical protein